MCIKINLVLVSHTRYHHQRWELKTITSEFDHNEIGYRILGHNAVTGVTFFEAHYSDRAVALQDFRDLCPEAMAA